MRPIVHCILLAFVGCAAWAGPKSDPIAGQVARAATEAFEDVRPFEKVEVFPKPDDPKVFAILWSDGFWFKSVRVLRFEHGRILWSAVLSPGNVWGDHCVLNARWVRMPGIGITPLEVYTSTHRGNGDYLLEQVKGDKLACLLSAESTSRYAYDVPRHVPKCNRDLMSESVERKGKFISVANGTYERVVVSGEISFFTEDEKLAVRQPLRQVFRWNAATGQFQEDVSKRIGDTRFFR
jgi:hypothetical protein